VPPLTSYSCKLTPEQAQRLEAALQAHGFRPRQVPYAQFAAEKEDVMVAFYGSGKLLVQGKGTRDFVEFILEPEVLQQARLGYETVLNPELLVPRVGVDESGKGDFFGPLCVAAVYVNEAVVKAWQGAGIRDSKHIGSDRRIAELAQLIRRTPGCVSTVVPIGNEAYNRLYARMGDLNAMLAWAHARAIENLLAQADRLNPPPVRAISDQFAANKAVLARALMPLGRQIQLVQRTQAEEDPAVAAASILARHEFVRRLAQLEQQWGVNLPKGASAAVDAAAAEFVAKHGPDQLVKVAKLHFRNARRILDQGQARPTPDA
jgi:ribonuclease HIII